MDSHKKRPFHVAASSSRVVEVFPPARGKRRGEDGTSEVHHRGKRRFDSGYPDSDTQRHRHHPHPRDQSTVTPTADEADFSPSSASTSALGYSSTMRTLRAEAHHRQQQPLGETPTTGHPDCQPLSQEPNPQHFYLRDAKRQVHQLDDPLSHRRNSSSTSSGSGKYDPHNSSSPSPQPPRHRRRHPSESLKHLGRYPRDEHQQPFDHRSPNASSATPLSASSRSMDWEGPHGHHPPHHPRHRRSPHHHPPSRSDLQYRHSHQQQQQHRDRQSSVVHDKNELLLTSIGRRLGELHHSQHHHSHRHEQQKLTSEQPQQDKESSSALPAALESTLELAVSESTALESTASDTEVRLVPMDGRKKELEKTTTLWGPTRGMDHHDTDVEHVEILSNHVVNTSRGKKVGRKSESILLLTPDEMAREEVLSDDDELHPTSPILSPERNPISSLTISPTTKTSRPASSSSTLLRSRSHTGSRYGEDDEHPVDKRMGATDPESDDDVVFVDGGMGLLLSPSVSSSVTEEEELPSRCSSTPEQTAQQATASESSSLGGSTKTVDSLVVPRNPLLDGCGSVDQYRRLNKISEGTYGSVYRAQQRQTEQIVALKHVKYHERLWEEGFPLTSLREISILLELDHPNIVNVIEVVVGENPNQVFMVMEYIEHELKLLLEDNRPQFSISERKRLILQLLKAVDYLHSRWVMHRDLKTSNLLYSNRGELKVCDFGMARKFGDPIKPSTHNVVTMWYRAPELLLGQETYTPAIDIWSVGCIMGEILSRRPVFDGRTETQTLDKIFKLCGTPTEESWPGMNSLPAIAKKRIEFNKHQPTWRTVFPAPRPPFTDSSAISDAGLDLLQSLLCLNPEKRITAHDALKHAFFEEKPLPQRLQLMPTAPDTNQRDRATRHAEDSLNEQDLMDRDLFHDHSASLYCSYRLLLDSLISVIVPVISLKIIIACLSSKSFTVCYSSSIMWTQDLQQTANLDFNCWLRVAHGSFDIKSIFDLTRERSQRNVPSHEPESRNMGETEKNEGRDLLYSLSISLSLSLSLFFSRSFTHRSSLVLCPLETNLLFVG